MFKRLVSLKEKSGLFLFIIRLPGRVTYHILKKINRLFWSISLGSMGKNVIIEWGAHFENPKNVFLGNNVHIGKNVRFGSEFIDGIAKIDDNVHINRDCIIDHSGDVIIGENTLLSSEVVVLTHSHGYDPKSLPIKKPITIGSNCWIGYGVKLLENTKWIGNNVLIASGAVVNKQCDDSNYIYGGIPARKIKKF